MISYLTERAFILDWRSPDGFNDIITRRYIDWTVNSLPGKVLKPTHVHEIGTPTWVDSHAGNVSEWYMATNFDAYFSNEVEVIQAHSYDFTFALLRNRHYQHKIRRYDLHNARCLTCCAWHYLFRFTAMFQTRMNSVKRRDLKMNRGSDLLYVNLPVPSDKMPGGMVARQVDRVMECVGKISSMVKHPVWMVASNRLSALDAVQEAYPSMLHRHGLFYSRELYTVDIQRHSSNDYTYKSIQIPRIEHNALLYYFIGFYLQLDSTVLFSQRHHLYSEVAAAVRHFYHPTKTYLVYPDQNCQMQRYYVQ